MTEKNTRVKKRTPTGKVIIWGRDNKIQSEHVYNKQKKYRLVKDFVIPAGTEFYEVVKMVEHKPMNTSIELSNDSVMSCSIWKDAVEDRPDLFEEVE